MNTYIKYPRTEHLPLSKEVDMDFVSKNNTALLSAPINHSIIIEEKMDGIGVGIGFFGGSPYIQQRGHIYSLDNIPSYLSELSVWIRDREIELYELIGEQFCLFGEWLYHKHSIFYDNLPDYFLEYDIYDKTNKFFLSTSERQKIISYLPWLFSVKVLNRLPALSESAFSHLLQQNPISYFKTPEYTSHLEQILLYHPQKHLLKENTLSDRFYEGFYIKVESSSSVLGRYKWIRKSFMAHILSGEHWKNSPYIPNQLNSISLTKKNTF